MQLVRTTRGLKAPAPPSGRLANCTFITRVYNPSCAGRPDGNEFTLFLYLLLHRTKGTMNVTRYIREHTVWLQTQSAARREGRGQGSARSAAVFTPSHSQTEKQGAKLQGPLKSLGNGIRLILGARRCAFLL